MGLDAARPTLVKSFRDVTVVIGSARWFQKIAMSLSPVRRTFGRTQY
jgi:hypothetical protein